MHPNEPYHYSTQTNTTRPTLLTPTGPKLFGSRQLSLVAQLLHAATLCLGSLAGRLYMSAYTTLPEMSSVKLRMSALCYTLNITFLLCCC
jgi:hypothetical protein